MKKSIKSSSFRFNKRRDSVFLLFVLGTCLFWFLNKMSKDYNQVVYYVIEYKSLPDEHIFQETPLKTLEFRVKASGFYFMTKPFRNANISISLAHLQKKNKYEYYLLNQELKRQTRAGIPENIDLVDVMVDSLFFKLGRKSFKKVPVISNVDIQYFSGYKSFSGVHISPDSILVSGPEMQVEKINSIALESVVRKEVQASIDEAINIIKPNIPKIAYDTEQVRLKVDIEKITEKKMLIPVQIINGPNQEVVVYPKKIAITCQVRLSQFNEVKASDFIIVCDYSKRAGKHLKPEISQQPSIVSSVKMAVSNVEYLILK